MSTTLAKYDTDDKIVARVNQLITSAEKLDPAVVTMQIARKIAQAETIADVLQFAEGGATGGREIVDRPFIMTDSLRWQKSTIVNDAAPFEAFVIMTCKMLDDDSEEVVTSGGTQVIMQALVLTDLGGVPGDTIYRFVSKPTASGYDTLYLGDGSALPAAQAWLKRRKDVKVSA